MSPVDPVSELPEDEALMHLKLQQDGGDLFPCCDGAEEISLTSSNDTPAPERAVCQPCTTAPHLATPNDEGVTTQEEEEIVQDLSDEEVSQEDVQDLMKETSEESVEEENDSVEETGEDEEPVEEQAEEENAVEEEVAEEETLEEDKVLGAEEEEEPVEKEASDEEFDEDVVEEDQEVEEQHEIEEHEFVSKSSTHTEMLLAEAASLEKPEEALVGAALSEEEEQTEKSTSRDDAEVEVKETVAEVTVEDVEPEGEESSPPSSGSSEEATHKHPGTKHTT